MHGFDLGKGLKQINTVTRYLRILRSAIRDVRLWRRQEFADMACWAIQAYLSPVDLPPNHKMNVPKKTPKMGKPSHKGLPPIQSFIIVCRPSQDSGHWIHRTNDSGPYRYKVRKYFVIHSPCRRNPTAWEASTPMPATIPTTIVALPAKRIRLAIQSRKSISLLPCLYVRVNREI